MVWTKPNVNALLKPFIDEVNIIYNNGLEFPLGQRIKLRVIPVLCSSDRVARPMIQKFKQFNGVYGCGFCCEKGPLVEKGNGRVRVYPFEQIPVRRNHNETLQQGERVTATENVECYIVGISRLFLLPKFDVIKCFVPEYMHAICRGVTRQFFSLWFDSTSHGEVFYLKDTKCVDKLLPNVRVPNEILRKPRLSDDCKFWKASEWRAFLVYFSPFALRGVLPDANSIQLAIR